jgi:hypothetical protein
MYIALRVSSVVLWKDVNCVQCIRMVNEWCYEENWRFVGLYVLIPISLGAIFSTSFDVYTSCYDNDITLELNFHVVHLIRTESRKICFIFTIFSSALNPFLRD